MAYRALPLQINSLAVSPDLALVYSGAKMPTKQVISIVAEKQRLEPAKYQQLYQEIEQCTQQAILALQNEQWQSLGKCMDQHHQLQTHLGVSTPLLEQLVSQLRQQSSIYGAKISGSGLGDCVIGLGAIPADLFPITVEQKKLGVQQISVKVSQRGYAHE